MDTFDIAAVCAHPDDAELVMGGTIAREAARGRRIALVDLTRGESGSRGTPETRAAEAAEAARILGAAHRESLGLPDAKLQVVPEHKDPMVAAIRRLRPRLILLQHGSSATPITRRRAASSTTPASSPASATTGLTSAPRSARRSSPTP